MKKLLVLTFAVIIVASFIMAGCSSPSATTSGPATSAVPNNPASATSAPPSTTLPPTTTTATAPSGSSASTEPIKIGAIVSLTGESSQTGPPEIAAMKYRLNLIGNQIDGRPIQLVVGDDGSSPTTVIDAIKKLTMLDKVDVIIGPTMGAAAVAAGNFMKTANPPIPILIVMAKSGTLLKNVPNNNVYLPMGTDVGTGYYTGLYEYDKLGYKTTTTMLEDMISGWDKVGADVKAFEKEGGKSIQQQVVKSGTVDFSAFLAAMKPADCVTVWLTPGPMARFVAQYYAAGKSMPLVIPDSSVLFSKTMSQIGDKTVGIVGEVNYSTLIDTPLNQEYVSGFQKAEGYVPTIQAAATDQALLAYLAALKATGGDPSPAKINPALHKVNIDTPAGPIAFTPQGMGIGDMYIAQSTKLPDRIDWKVLYSYNKIVLDEPQ